MTSIGYSDVHMVPTIARFWFMSVPLQNSGVFSPTKFCFFKQFLYYIFKAKNHSALLILASDSHKIGTLITLT